ncbi:MAG: acetoacetate--CoA ligase [Chloroflexota bacterium]
MKTPLWEPSQERKDSAGMIWFMDYVNRRYAQKIGSYDELHRWSVENLPDFWAAMWDFCEVKASKPYDAVLRTGGSMMEAAWFPGARLNFAENLLRFRDNRKALVFVSESGKRVTMTFAELYDEVAGLAVSLRGLGVKAGDRVAGFMPNMIETVVAMLASASIGATWSSCSPDFGIRGALDRFVQIQPKVLFTADGYYYNGKVFDSLEKTAALWKELPSVAKVVIVPYTGATKDMSLIPGSISYGDFITRERGLTNQFTQVPADHPLYIMYSSGTTGLPKCIVQGAAGILLGHLRDLKLHTDVGRADTIFYYTSCGWMMWNWLVSALALGATVLLYDGSPFYPGPGALFKMAQDEGVTIFGTSAKYLTELEKSGVKPSEEYDLSRLKTILSTGSPLSAASFEFVYRNIKKDLCLSSISGGTDINGCFFLGNPTLPVYRGELQCKGLGMDVRVFDDAGRSVVGAQGELVCLTPYPSMPLYFWNDKDGQKYHDAYFSYYPGIWRHGDYLAITENGGAVIYGRSDATLKPQGVRIGTAEIYRIVEGISEVKDSIVVGQNWEGDVRIVLFVRLADGVALTDGLVKKMKETIRYELSPRHVPAKVLAVPDIPYTVSGKKVELAVRKVIHHEPVLNAGALANPEALAFYRDIPELES